MEQKPEEQNYGFTEEEREKILKEKFNVGNSRFTCKEVLLEDIIDGVINAIKDAIKDDDNDKKNDGDYEKDDDNIKDCIKKYWFTKQIEKWKDNNKTDKDPEDGDLIEIVKKDLKIRIANTMLELKKTQYR